MEGNETGFPYKVLFVTGLAVLTTSLPIALFDERHVDPTGTRVGGPIVGDVTWTSLGNPYWIEGWVEITPGSILRMQAGVRAEFKGPDGVLAVNGSLEALGTASSPIVFTRNATSPPNYALGLRVNGGSLTAREVWMDHAAVWVTGAVSFHWERVRFSDSDWIPLNQIASLSITWSTFSGIPRSGLDISDSPLARVSYNEFRSVSFGGIAMKIQGSPNSEVIGNTIERFATGIDGDSDSMSIVDNTVEDCTVGVIASSNAIISNNRLRTYGAGVQAVQDMGVTILDNVIWGNSLAGILLDETQSAAVERNTVVGSIVGVHVAGQSTAAITGNTFRENEVGIRLQGGGPHMVHHNRIIHNGQQAVDQSVGSAWDDGWPSGGNYWSDYVGDDVYSGPMQDLPGPDGIGDTPRPVGPSGIDRYPIYVVPAPGIPSQLTARAVGPDVVLTWQPVGTADDYLLSLADTPTGFDFSAPLSLGNVTAWTDVGATEALGPRYYVVRARNATVDRAGPTSTTAAKWTHAFPVGSSTWSLPLERYPWIDYAQPGWVDTVGEFATATGASSVSYMEAGSWKSVPGLGSPTRQTHTGEGYVIELPAAITLTFTGIPGSMIDFAGWPPYQLAGFDPATTAKSMGARVDGEDIVVSWDEIPGFGTPGAAYEVYAADAPWKFRGTPWTDYRLIAVVPATGAGQSSIMHRDALLTTMRWFYLVVPAQNGDARGPSTYSVGVSVLSVPAGPSAIGLPLRANANGTYVTSDVSSLLGPEIRGVLWFDLGRQDWVAHAAWMGPGTYDTPFAPVMAAQVDSATPTRISFVGV